MCQNIKLSWPSLYATMAKDWCVPNNNRKWKWTNLYADPSETKKCVFLRKGRTRWFIGKNNFKLHSWYEEDPPKTKSWQKEEGFILSTVEDWFVICLTTLSKRHWSWLRNTTIAVAFYKPLKRYLRKTLRWLTKDEIPLTKVYSFIYPKRDYSFKIYESWV